MSATVLATDPARWQAAAMDWRRWAAAAGFWAARIQRCAARLRDLWSGACAEAVVAALTAIVHRLTLLRLGCWAADQALSEFAAALTRARRTGASAAAADQTHAGTLRRLFPAPPPHPTPTPFCTATAPQVHAWWQSLSPAQRDDVTARQPDWLGALDGVPASARDRANRLLLDNTRASGGIRLPADLAARLDAESGPRAYLMGIDPAGDGRAVVALGDPDQAAAVVTHVPGMTADLASYRGELTRADRLAVRAAELAPDRPASAVMWLGYDAPDDLVEAAGRAPAAAGADRLRRFQEGLRVTHEGEPARQTLLGHSYGSLVVGTAAAQPGLAADSVVFVGSPGVGVDHAGDLRVPRSEVYAMTAFSDPVQWAAVAPDALARDLLVSRAIPGGAAHAFLRPEDELFFGRNPADPAFGARSVASQPDAGHVGYWDEGRPALDALARIVTGRADVTPR
ncbi:alpha/beta hydrolase [Actinoplanes sp. RD1]|uniref:alpha/beta hydrolase n=1 Tax=Actinoplanes sp. RD1 TaxID=3064538 RepID=UPI0027424670|nr:alpha/beta hydrolase [Actinoplanes sp. RD1]